MRLRPAHHNKHRLSLLVLFATLATAMPAQNPESATPTLDLTKPVPREEQLNVLPGSEIGGVLGQPQPPGYPLPLAVELQSVSPDPVRANEKFTAEVLLRNTGGSVFLLPASRKIATVLKQGNKGRRTFLFSLVFEEPQHGRKLSFVMVSTEGAETVPESFLRLGPGQTVRVLLAGGLNSVDQQEAMSQWLKDGVKEVRVRAEVSEWKFEDKRYFIETRAKPVFSGNSVLLDLVPPD